MPRKELRIALVEVRGAAGVLRLQAIHGALGAVVGPDVIRLIRERLEAVGHLQIGMRPEVTAQTAGQSVEGQALQRVQRLKRLHVAGRQLRQQGQRPHGLHGHTELRAARGHAARQVLVGAEGAVHLAVEAAQLGPGEPGLREACSQHNENILLLTMIITNELT